MCGTGKSAYFIIEKSIVGYIEQIEPLTSTFDIPWNKNELGGVATAAERLVGLHGVVEKRVRERTAAEEALEKAKRRLEERKRDLHRAKAEMMVLLSSGDAGDVEEFRKRQEIYRQRTDLIETRRMALNRLQRISGPGEYLENLKKMLRETDIQAINDKARRVEEERDAADTHTKELDTERGSIETELQTLTSEEESSRLRTNRSILLEQMREHAQEWAKKHSCRATAGRGARHVRARTAARCSPSR